MHNAASVWPGGLSSGFFTRPCSPHFDDLSEKADVALAHKISHSLLKGHVIAFRKARRSDNQQGL